MTTVSLMNGSKKSAQLLNKDLCTAESFCDYFTNFAINLEKKSFLLRDLLWSNPSEIRLPQVREKFFFRAMKEEEILTELKNLKRKKATGLENLPPGLLKDAVGVIAKPLTFIINLSLSSGVVPTDWKMAKVIPIFKFGSMAEIGNYRPISILPALSKILEKMVHKQLLKHLEFNGFLPEHQFGFRPNRSTELAATFFTDLIRKEARTEAKLLGQSSSTCLKRLIPSATPFC